MNNSALSRFGLGMEFNDGLSRNIGMGNTGVASMSPDHLNLQNPALLSHNRMTNFEFNGFFEAKSLKIPDVSQRFSNYSAGPSYLAFGFPLGKRANLAFGGRPVTEINYNVQNKDFFKIGTDSFQNAYSGKGSISKAFISLAWEPLSGFSIGLESSFMIGNLSQNDIALSKNQANSFLEENQYAVKTFQFKPGVSWYQKLNKVKDINISFGATATLNDRFNFRQTRIFSTQSQGLNLNNDTLFNNQKTSIPIGRNIKGGICLFRPFRWLVTADFSFTPAVESFGLLYKTRGNDSYEANVGAEYSPGIAKSTKYLNIVTYRAGGFFRQEPFLIDGKTVTTQQISIGFSFPILRKEAKFTRPLINIAFFGGFRGVSQSGLNNERYGGITLGFTLNDSLWFRRYKVD